MLTATGNPHIEFQEASIRLRIVDSLDLHIRTTTVETEHFGFCGRRAGHERHEKQGRNLDNDHEAERRGSRAAELSEGTENAQRFRRSPWSHLLGAFFAFRPNAIKFTHLTADGYAL